MTKLLISEPVEPPVPEAKVYGVDAIALFKQYDRKTYEEEFGVQAPAFDVSLPPKLWFDTTAKDFTTYRSFEPAAKTPITDNMLIEKPGRINLPGEYRYPARTVVPSGAYVIAAGDKQTINAGQLSTWDEATALAGELEKAGLFASGSLVVQVIEQWGFVKVLYEAGETRRQHVIFSEGLFATWNVGQLLTAKAKNGVGYPGKWTLVGREILWTAGPPPVTENKLTPVPVPVRALREDETVVKNAMGLWEIHREDPLETTVGFTLRDRKMLEAVYEWVGGDKKGLGFIP